MPEETKQVWTPEFGAFVRICVVCEGRIVQLMWVRRVADGSIYVGMTMEAPVEPLTTPLEFNDGKAVIDRSKLQPLREGIQPKSTRVSFKASGEIHTFDQNIQGIPLLDLKTPLHLATIMFRHPRLYPTIPVGGREDFDLIVNRFPWDDERRASANVSIHPMRRNAEDLVYVEPNFSVSKEMLLAFGGIDRDEYSIVRISLGHGPKIPWDERGGIVIYNARDPALANR